MKNLSAKLILFPLTIALFFIVSGCSSIFGRTDTAPKNVYKNFISTDIDDSENTDYADFVYASNTGNTVSVVSSFWITDGTSKSQASVVQSGIILNKDGYVLTHVSSAYAYSTECQSVYAILSPIYKDNTKYKLELVDYNTDAGLALFVFYDHFYYYENESKDTLQEGFQFTPVLSKNDIKTGERCVVIGNALGDFSLYGNDLLIKEQMVTSGIVSDSAADGQIFEQSFNGTQYEYLQISAAANPETIGGGVFDENGYMIGILATKVISTSDNSGNSYLNKTSLVSGTTLIIDYINYVSEKTETVIQIEVAVKQSV